MLKNLLNILSKKKLKISDRISDIKFIFPVKKLFSSFNNYSLKSEIRYVGGCVRKSILKEKIDDIDLATNLTPHEVQKCLTKNKIKYLNTGEKFGTITAIIDKYKFEITSLRKDIKNDGRHPIVEYTNNWREDAERRDFTFNSIYSNIGGDIFDPFDGKEDLLKGKVKFIGEPSLRIKEDYLRILRYIRFFLNHSTNMHDPKVVKAIRENIAGIKKISKERLIDELKKILLSKGFIKINQDSFSKEIIELIFPQIQNFNICNPELIKLIEKKDFILIISLLIINHSDNAIYFLHKYNFSKEDHSRIIFLNGIFGKKVNRNFFEKINLMKIFYKKGRKSVIDIISFKLIQKNDDKLKNLIPFFENVEKPEFPIKAELLLSNYKFKEGKILGKKIRELEMFWLNNNFQISKSQIEKIINN